MLNRRHIRLKIMQYLYAAEISDFEDTKEHYNNLTSSIHSIHYLFLLQISFLIEILKKAEEIEKNSNQLLNYTNIIKQNSNDIKKDIVEHLWKVIISDNSVDQYESNLMRRVCGLIYFSDKMSAEIKLQLLNNK